MSYIYLQEQGEESSVDSFSDIPRSALSSLRNTLGESSSKGSETASCHDSQSGTTSELSTLGLGEESRTSSVAGSPVRTSVQQEKEQGSKASGPDCGERWPESFAKYDLDSSLWRTHQYSLLGDLELFSETWPRWGTMRDGACWEQTTQARHTSGKGSGYWQTPVADDSVNRLKGKINSRGEPKLSAQVLLPTPTASSYGNNRGGSSGRKGEVRLSLASMASQDSWPTPTVCGNYNRKGVSKKSGDGLATAVWSKDGKSRMDQLPNRVAYGGDQTRQKGQLNPEWVEWLMGWPIGWTDLNPSGMVKFQQWLHSHGEH